MACTRWWDEKKNTGGNYYWWGRVEESERNLPPEVEKTHVDDDYRRRQVLPTACHYLTSLVCHKSDIGYTESILDHFNDGKYQRTLLIYCPPHIRDVSPLWLNSLRPCCSYQCVHTSRVTMVTLPLRSCALTPPTTLGLSSDCNASMSTEWPLTVVPAVHGAPHSCSLVLSTPASIFFDFEISSRYFSNSVNVIFLVLKETTISVSILARVG